MTDNLKFEFEQLSKEIQKATIEVFKKRWGGNKRSFLKYLNGFEKDGEIYLWLCWQIFAVKKIWESQSHFKLDDFDDEEEDMEFEN